ncbi:MAG: peptidoglycan-binding protein [Candidatus Peregrinibacteria bacterium]
MKKILTFLILFVYLATTVPVAFGQSMPGEPRKFLVTAYYSPQPGQRFYITGTYQGDIRLNGRGTNGADGTEVYVGMLAAPSTYPFGTRIRLPGLGVGEVHDRGGAIIARADYDRIDIWMGAGEEGLARALNWGAQFVDGEVYFAPDQVEPGLSFHTVSTALSESLVARLENRTKLSNSYVLEQTAEEATPEQLKDLQTAMTLFGFYNGPIDGQLTEQTEKSILLFQLSEGIIKDEKEAGAGHFGPTTRGVLKERLARYDVEAEKEQNRLRENRMLLAAGLGKDAGGQDVEALQRMLWELGYYHGPVSHRYDELTIEAVFDFQQANGILNSAYDKGAGYYGDQTHEALVAAVDARITKVKEYPKEMQAWIPVKVPLPLVADMTPVSADFKVRSLHFEVAFAKKYDFEFTRPLEAGAKGEAVTALQDVLIGEGYLEAGLNTGYFGAQTRAALVRFQMERGVISSDADMGAGLVGPKTMEVLNDLS